MREKHDGFALIIKINRMKKEKEQPLDNSKDRIMNLSMRQLSE